MARKRMIDPSFWEDEKLGTLDPLARLLFMGLISQADDEGRLKGHPSLLRSLIFPYDDYITLQQIEEWLGYLAEPKRHLIDRYELDNQKYIWIRNFKKHQTINKPQKSKLPSLPDDYGSNTVTIPDEDGITTAQKKLREEKLKEEKLREEEDKEKGRESPPIPPSDNPHQDYILKIINENQITYNNFYVIEKIYSYIGVADIEVFEAAVKKSNGKNINYCLKTLEGMIQEGVTKKEHLPQQVTPGFMRPIRKGTSGKPQIPLPATQTNEPVSPERLEEIRRKAQAMDKKLNQRPAEV